MVSKIVRFEFVNRFKTPFTYLFIAMGLFQGLWFTIGAYNTYANAGTFRNAPVIMYQIHAGMGMLIFIITAIVAATTLMKDLDSKTAETTYSGLADEKKFFAGRFLSAFLINIVLTTSFTIGMLLPPFLGIGTPDQYGPVPLGQIFHGFAFLTIPNLFLITSVSVSFVVFFRKASAAYAAVLGLIMLFMMSELLWDSSVYKTILMLLDPCGYTAVKDIINGMSVISRNSEYLVFSRELILNRIVWGLIAAGLVTAAWFRFSFKYFITTKSKKVVVRKENKTVASDEYRIGEVNRDFSRWELIKKAFRISVMELRTVVKPFAFKMTMGFLFLIFLGYNFFWAEKYFLTTVHLPITSNMTFSRFSMSVYMAVLVMVWAGELLFRDRKDGSWRIIDATPTPSWVHISARYIAMSVVALIISGMLLLAGVITQLSKGFHDIEWGLYAQDLMGTRFGWVTYLFLVAMAFFFGTLFNNRRSGHVLGVSVFIFILVSAEFQLMEEIRFMFPLVPGIEGYSEMNGFGMFDVAHLWCSLMWLFLSGLMAVLFLLLWNRGIKRPFSERVQVAAGRFNWKYGLSIVVMLGGLLYSHNVFYYNVYELAGFKTTDQKAAEASAYEKKLAGISGKQHYKITDLKLNLDLYPSERRADYQAELSIINSGTENSDRIYLSLKKFLEIRSFSVQGIELKPAEVNEDLRYIVYKTGTPVKAGEVVTVQISASLQYKGFHQSDPQGDLVYNGTFLGVDLLPHFGYDESRELDDNKDRMETGLEKLKSRMSGIDNSLALGNRVSSDQSDGVKWDITVSTSREQTAIAPGKLVKKWNKNNRNYYNFQSDSEGRMDFKILSARYENHEFEVEGTPVSIYYDKKHGYNIVYYQEALAEAFRWLSERLGKYPYSNLIVAEKTLYDDAFYTFHNVITISEKNGWAADMRELRGREYLHRTLMKELASQWIRADLRIADVQGADIFTASLPEYFSLLYMADLDPDTGAIKWLDQSCSNYLEGRGVEAIVEPALLRSDNAEYVGRDKGGLALHSIAMQMGVDKFNRWLRFWIHGNSGIREKGFLTSEDFYSDLKAFVPAELKQCLSDWFEKRVMYRLALKNAGIKEGKLEMSVSSARWLEEGLGKTVKQDLPFNMEVAVRKISGEVVKLGVLSVNPGTVTYKLEVPEDTRGEIIIDPWHWYPDEGREDNVKKVNI